MSNLVKAVVFDMDGTLIDTERIYQQFWVMASEELGYNLTRDQLLQLRSLGVIYAEPLVTEMTNDPEAYIRIKTKRAEMMDPYMQSHEIEQKPFVREALTLLRDNGFRLAVATGTDVEHTAEYLRRAGLIDFFGAIVSARMFEKGKPSPDVYLYACEKIGAKPENAYAVEDAPNGILSAKNAGMKVVMVPDLTEPDEELMKLLDYRADNLLDAAEFIAKGDRHYEDM